MDPQVSHGANRLYVSMAAWNEEPSDILLEFWAGIASDESGHRSLVSRATVDSGRAYALDDVIHSNWSVTVDRATRLFEMYGARIMLDERFISSRAGDATNLAM